MKKYSEHPTLIQTIMRAEHSKLADEFLYDADGITIYAKCSDGFVKITPNREPIKEVHETPLKEIDNTIRPTIIEPAKPVTEYRTPIPKKDYSKKYEAAKAAYKIPYRPSFEEMKKMFIEPSENDLTDNF